MPTIHLRPRDGYPEFLDEVRTAGWSMERAYREFGVKNQAELLEETDRRGGWAFMTMVLRSIKAKLAQDAEISATNPQRPADHKAEDVLWN